MKYVKQPNSHIVLDDFEWQALVKGINEYRKQVIDEDGCVEGVDEAMNEMHSLTKVEAFSYGFRLEVKQMIGAGVPLAKEST